MLLGIKKEGHMKWPLSLTIIRHGQSTYNALRDKKKADPDYQEFVKKFDARVSPEDLRKQALELQKRLAINVSDYHTTLTQEGFRQAKVTGQIMWGFVPPADVVFISPYVRTRQTFTMITNKLPDGKWGILDDRIREQEHGLSLLYSDWRIFQTIHPEQRALHELQGPYWYQYPQGESVSMVRERTREFMSMLIREYAEKHVWLITHHLTLLSIRANLERLSPEEFIRIDEEEKPVNCGVTIYEGHRGMGTSGKLVLKCYNRKLYGEF